MTNFERFHDKKELALALFAVHNRGVRSAYEQYREVEYPTSVIFGSIESVEAWLDEEDDAILYADDDQPPYSEFFARRQEEIDRELADQAKIIEQIKQNIAEGA